jgi:molecular chaperone GrpE
MEKENANIKDVIITKFVKDLIDVCDHFDKTLLSIKDKVYDKLTNEERIKLYKSFIDNVYLTHTVLSNTLKKHGVSEYSPLNEKFDPNKHDAVFDYPDEDKVF